MFFRTRKGRKRTLEVSLRIFENFNFFRNFEAKSIFQPGRMLLIYILELKDLEIVSPQLSKASINVEFVEDPHWSGCEFITKKKGAQGPTKEDCKHYYAEWYVSFYNSLFFKLILVQVV